MCNESAIKKTFSTRVFFCWCCVWDATRIQFSVNKANAIYSNDLEIWTIIWDSKSQVENGTHTENLMQMSDSNGNAWMHFTYAAPSNAPQNSRDTITIIPAHDCHNECSVKRETTVIFNRKSCNFPNISTIRCLNNIFDRQTNR